MAEWEELLRRSKIAWANDDIVEATKLAKEALAHAQEAPPVAQAQLHNRVADLCFRVNEISNAESHARNSLCLEREYGDCGAETTRLAEYCLMLAKILSHQNRQREARPLVEEALKVVTDLLGENNTYVNWVRGLHDDLRRDSWRT